MAFINAIGEGWLPDVATCGESARVHVQNMSFQGRKQCVGLCNWIGKQHVPSHNCFQI